MQSFFVTIVEFSAEKTIVSVARRYTVDGKQTEVCTLYFSANSWPKLPRINACKIKIIANSPDSILNHAPRQVVSFSDVR